MTADKRNPVTVLRALEILSEEFGEKGASKPLAYARVFLHIATAGEEGLDNGALVRMMGTSGSGVTRAVQELGSRSWIKDDQGDKTPGMELITTETNPQNFRLRTHKLTPKGKKLLSRLGGIK